MWRILLLVVVLIGVGIFWRYHNSQQPSHPIQTTDFYQLSAMDISGNKISFEQFRGKKVMLVNIASRCGFTPQLWSLQNFYELYHDRIEIVWMPCDQFLNQSPENEADMRLFCQRNYGVTFPLTEKLHVRGSQQHPIYQWLTSKSLNGVKDSRVTWNFQKYIIDENGLLVDIFAPSVSPFDPKIVAYVQ